MLRGDERALPAQIREELGPALGDLPPELDDRNPRRESGDLRAAARSPSGAAGEPDAYQELSVHDRREDDGFLTEIGEHPLPGKVMPLHGDERARIDYEAHGSSGGRSAAPTRSRSSAKPTSGSPAERQALNAS